MEKGKGYHHVRMAEGMKGNAKEFWVGLAGQVEHRQPSGWHSQADFCVLASVDGL
jgi:hypothetical protein